MKRVASLYLPNWSIDLLRRAERRHARPAEADSRPAFRAIGAEAAAERAMQCSVPNEGGWRPGARWAKQRHAAVEAEIAALPTHQRPPQRELGRLSEAADNPFRGEAPLRELSRRTEAATHPFRPMPVDEAGQRFAPRVEATPRRSVRDGHGGEAGFIAPPNLAQLAAMPSVQFPGEGPHPDNHGKSAPTAPTYGQGRFFQTSRTLGSVVARICRDEIESNCLTPAAAAAPLVTTQKVGSRVELAAVDPAARGLGLQPGMALTMARAQVPGLDVRAADPEGDADSLHRLAVLLARRWAPTVAVSDPDGLFIDLTGVAHLHGGEARFAARLIRLLARQGIEARLAVADTAGAAWALARFAGPDAVCLAEPGAQGRALAQLPMQALRLAPASLELLARLGVETIGELLAFPRAPLVRRFGAEIALRLDQAAGTAPEPLVPVVPPSWVAVEQRFAEPIATAEAIEHWLGVLVPRLTRALAEEGQGARAVELVAERIDGVPQLVRLGFARPTRDPAHILRLAIRRIEEIEPGYGIDALRLHVRRSDPLGPEPLAGSLAAEAESDLTCLIDTLANRIGDGRLWRAAPVESDVPERCATRIAPLAPAQEKVRALKRDDVRGLDGRAPDHPWHPRWPRPIRLLRHPERIGHVMAELPDQPPRRFTWRGVTHRVVHAEGPERIAGEWWRRAAEQQAVRDYYRVEDESGRRFWLYRRGDGVRAETGDLTWLIHGIGW